MEALSNQVLTEQQRLLARSTCCSKKRLLDVMLLFATRLSSGLRV
jgi:hypothetical protein